jgi:signal transduction histidine kinase
LVITLQEISPGGPAPAPDLAKHLQVLANAERLMLLQALMAAAREPAALSNDTGVPLQAVRRHLRTLAAAGLIKAVPVGEDARYEVDAAGVTLLTASLVQQLSGSQPSPDSVSGVRTDEALDVYTVDVPAAPERCLTCSNSGFVRRVLDDLDRVLAEARIYHGQLQHLSSQVLTAHEGERKRIARELHDDTGQALTSILVRLRLLEKTAGDETVRKNVEELRELTGNALDSVRRMAVDLRPAALDDLGLVPALHSYADKYSNSWPISVTFSAEGLKKRLPANVELVLYRIVQEALTNVAKHSGARCVEVKLRRRSNTVTVTVADNGRGFDLRDVTRREGAGLGLFGMRERLALVGGTVAIESTPGQGTTITARVPLRAGGHNHRKGE